MHSNTSWVDKSPWGQIEDLSYGYPGKVLSVGKFEKRTVDTRGRLIFSMRAGIIRYKAKEIQ